MDQDKKYLITVPPNGKITTQEITKVPNLEQLQKAVGGYIELIPYFSKYEGKKCIALCNENGKIKGLPANRIAQKLWETAYGSPIRLDHLVGSIAIIVGPPEFLEEV
jgi:hypothetical protein